VLCLIPSKTKHISERHELCNVNDIAIMNNLHSIAESIRAGDIGYEAVCAPLVWKR
jgi:hypothetical protein